MRLVREVLENAVRRRAADEGEGATRRAAPTPRIRRASVWRGEGTASRHQREPSRATSLPRRSSPRRKCAATKRESDALAEGAGLTRSPRHRREAHEPSPHADRGRAPRRSSVGADRRVPDEGRLKKSRAEIGHSVRDFDNSPTPSTTRTPPTPSPAPSRRARPTSASSWTARASAPP